MLGAEEVPAGPFDLVDPLGEGACDVGEVGCPVRAAGRGAGLELGESPESRGEHGRLDAQHAFVVEHDGRARALPGPTSVVGIPVLAEGPMQMLVAVLEVVHTEVHGVLPGPRPLPLGLGRGEGVPGQGFPG